MFVLLFPAYVLSLLPNFHWFGALFTLLLSTFVWYSFHYGFKLTTTVSEEAPSGSGNTKHLAAMHNKLTARCWPVGGGVHWVCMHPRNNTHTRLTALFPGLPGWAGTRKVKPIWILLKQQTVSCSGISWAICKSAPRCRQITTPAPHRSVFYRPDALPAAQPTASKHWSTPEISKI